MVVNQSEFNPDASHLTSIGQQIGDYFLSVTMSLPDPLTQQKHYETLYGTQSGRDDLLFTNMINPLFSFLLSVVGSRRFFFTSLLYFVFMNKLVLCK